MFGNLYLFSVTCDNNASNILNIFSTRIILPTIWNAFSFPELWRREGLLFISLNYGIFLKWILVCSWIVALRIFTIWNSRFIWTAYIFSFAPRTLSSEPFKPIREFFIIQSKNWKWWSFLTLNVEHRKVYKAPNLL
jgi:hypothetical protein